MNSYRTAIFTLAIAGCGGAPFEANLFQSSSSSEQDAGSVDSSIIDTPIANDASVVDAQRDVQPTSIQDAQDAQQPHDATPVDQDACPFFPSPSSCVNGPAQTLSFQASSQFCYLTNLGPNVLNTPSACLCDYTCACLGQSYPAILVAYDGGTAPCATVSGGGIAVDNRH